MSIASVIEGTRSEIIDVPVERCFVDRYGRPEVPGRVAKLVARFNPDALGVIMVSARPYGGYAIVDGQHRIKAAAEKGLTHVRAQVFHGLTYEQEAELYGLFANVANQTARDRFRARLEMHEPIAVTIKQIIESHGLGISWTAANKDGHISALAACERIYLTPTIGPELLNDTIALIKQTWGTSYEAFTFGFLRGIAGFLLRYRNVYDRQRFITRLSGITPRRLQAKAEALADSMGSATNTQAIGLAAMYQYNVGLHHKLPEWKHHTMTAPVTEEYRASRSPGGKAAAAARKAKAAAATAEAES